MVPVVAGERLVMIGVPHAAASNRLQRFCLMQVTAANTLVVDGFRLVGPTIFMSTKGGSESTTRRAIR